MKLILTLRLTLKKLSVFKLGLLVICLYLTSLENLYSQSFCATLANKPDFLKTIKSSLLFTPASSYNIGIFFHIMRRTDGTGGQTQQEVNTAFNTLYSDYQAYNIYLILLGTDEIRNDTYYNYNSMSNFLDANNNTDANGDGKFDVFNINTHSNAIDIYLFADDKLNFGLAANIPGTALVIGGNSFNTNLASSHVLTHEFGHCLGLFHTFHGTYTYEAPAGSCAELVNGSNGTTCGDFVQDTPADPAHIFDCGTQSTCTWNCSANYIDANGAHYNPNTHLFMAYTFPNCMNLHSNGQVTRMFNTIVNSSLLINTLIPTITGPDLLCSSGGSYTVNSPRPGTLTWQKSNNIDWVSGTNPATFRANGFNNYWGWIQAYFDGIAGPIINVWSGRFESTVVTGTAQVCPGSLYVYTAQVPVGYPSFYSYSWTYPSNWMKNSQNQNTVQLQTPMYNMTYGAVRVAITNQCGTAGYSGITVYPRYGCPQYFTVFPNPASDNITITIIDNSSSYTDTTFVNQNIANAIVPTNFTVRIYNSQSALISSVKRNGLNFSVPLTNMRDGTYIVEVSDGKTSTTQTLIVKHN
jgi:hypothetical protein